MDQGTPTNLALFVYLLMVYILPILPNIICTVTNLWALPAIYNYTVNDMVLQAYCVFFIMIASICYHMIEHHKHNMPGIGIFDDKLSHHIFLNLDRALSIISIIVCYDSIIFTKPYLMIVLFAISCVTIAENFAKSIPSYVIWHSLWHLSVFELARQISATYY